MLYQNPAIQSRVEVHLVEEAKGGPSKLLLSFLLTHQLYRKSRETERMLAAFLISCGPRGLALLGQAM
jgi:hypothetical protein